MVSNAYTECKQVIGSMRAATAFLRELPEVGAAGERPAPSVKGMEANLDTGEHGTDHKVHGPAGRQEGVG
jgi:hypothetical protein